MNTPGLFGSPRPLRCRSWWQLKGFVLNAGTLASVLLSDSAEGYGHKSHAITMAQKLILVPNW
jgi:hypothetical protein